MEKESGQHQQHGTTIHGSHHHVNLLRDLDLERLFHALVSNPCRQQWSPTSLVTHSYSILKQAQVNEDEKKQEMMTEVLKRLSFLKTMPINEQTDLLSWCVGLDEWPIQPVTLAVPQSQPQSSSTSSFQHHLSPKRPRKK